MKGGLISIECPREEYSCFVKVSEVASCQGVPELPSAACLDCKVGRPFTGRVALVEVKDESRREKAVRVKIFPLGIRVSI